jgi:hypothetical protein
MTPVLQVTDRCNKRRIRGQTGQDILREWERLLLAYSTHKDAVEEGAYLLNITTLVGTLDYLKECLGSRGVGKPMAIAGRSSC